MSNLNKWHSKLSFLLISSCSVFAGDTHLSHNFNSKFTIENNGNMIALNQDMTGVNISDLSSNLSKPTDSIITVYNSSDEVKSSGALAKGDYLKITNGANERKYLLFSFKPQVTNSTLFEEEHILFLTEDGKVYSYGSNEYGQLGLGDRENRTSPTQITVAGENNITSISAGNNHSLLLDRDGKVYSFGLNGEGQLGLGDTDIRLVPTQITVAGENNVTSISAIESYSMLLDKDGKIYKFGLNSSNTPIEIFDAEENNITSIKDSYLIDKDNMVYHYTNETCNYEYGICNPLSDYTFIEQFTTEENNITSFAVGEDYNRHLLLLDKNGKLYGFGSNNYGELGLGDDTFRDTPTQITQAGENNITSFAVGSNHSLLLDKDGKLYGFGSNNNLGFNTEDIYTYCGSSLCIKTPKEIVLNTPPIISILGSDLLLAEDGAIYNVKGNENWNVELIEQDKTIDLTSVVQPNKWSMISVPDKRSLSIENIPNNPVVWGYEEGWTLNPSTLNASFGYWINTTDTTGYDELQGNRELTGIKDYYNYPINFIKNNNKEYTDEFELIKSNSSNWRLIGVSKTKEGLSWSDLYSDKTASSSVELGELNCYPITFYYDNINDSWNTSEKVPYLGALWVKHYCF